MAILSAGAAVYIISDGVSGLDVADRCTDLAVAADSCTGVAVASDWCIMVLFLMFVCIVHSCS